MFVKGELSDPTSRSLGDSELPPLVRRTSVVAGTDNFLYSFDRTDTTPGMPMALDIFVKAPTGRETEKFVEKEYEILDGNGEALKGRKARRELRHTGGGGGAGSGGVEEVVEDEGFELL